jgi:hypothetical protein
MTPCIIEELCEIVATARPKTLDSGRMRLAVSPDEYKEIKEYMLDRYGDFYTRIMNVPLVVEANPKSQPLIVQGKRS